MLTGEEEYSSLDAMAAAYTDEVLAFQSTGPYRLFGFSLGGYLAASVAERLEAAGEVVDFVGVADCPDYSVSMTADRTDSFARMIASSYQQAVPEIPFLRPIQDPDGSLHRQIARNLMQSPEDGPELLLEWMTDNGGLSGPVPRQTLLEYLRRLARHLLLVGTSQRRPAVRGPLYVWQATRGIGGGSEVWRRAGGLAVSTVLVEADHVTLMTPPALDVIAQKLNSVCRAGLPVN